MIDVMRVLPHREPFLFLHRVTSLEPGVRAEGFVTIPADHPYALGQSSVPTGLVIEAMAQVGCVAAAPSHDRPMRGLFRGIQDFWMEQEAPFGVRLEVIAEVTRQRGRLMEVRAGAGHDGQEIAGGTLSFAAL